MGISGVMDAEDSQRAPGVWVIESPTGAGKTLAFVELLSKIMRRAGFRDVRVLGKFKAVLRSVGFSRTQSAYVFRWSLGSSDSCWFCRRGQERRVFAAAVRMGPFRGSS